ncbi:MAG: 2,4-dihydroxyhept-2-ene-1,7-dioic acid aldolase [Gammaproteobacteria bacterium RIFCSPHIGHO2_12_FULL_38_11]|nr:MAG: 2,4-dihydroxyhept-2-ene-1,7-dioic acid aldolase [Gammaproteobacteria bacterium RIFCSPHIGHO2_12_FULL_38_11]
MFNKSIKETLNNKVVTIGSWITIGNTAIAEIMARSKFDWLTIDMEHSAITLSEAQQLIQVIDANNVIPFVRVGENSPILIKHVMDAGAHGVIVPMVNTREEAMKAVESVKYPPLGKRGVGLGRAQGYGNTFDEYKKWVKTDSIVIVQIEHIHGVENLESILSVDEIDGFFVGPYDLSGSLGCPGEFNHPDMLKALDHIRNVAKSYKKSVGLHVIHPNPDEVSQRIEEGYNFIAFSLDTLFLSTMCHSTLSKINIAHQN